MTNVRAAEFFGRLQHGSHLPRLARYTGSVRFEIVRTDGVDCWRIEIVKGDVTVSRDDAVAEAVVRADRSVMDAIIAGQMDAVTAILRGVATVQGNRDLVLICERLIGEVARANAGVEVTS